MKINHYHYLHLFDKILLNYINKCQDTFAHIIVVYKASEPLCFTSPRWRDHADSCWYLHLRLFKMWIFILRHQFFNIFVFIKINHFILTHNFIHYTYITKHAKPYYLVYYQFLRDKVASKNITLSLKNSYNGSDAL